MAAPITTIDLFAGAGGLSAGFQTASSRYVPVVAVELDRAAAATYAANHPGTSVVSGSVEQWLAHGRIPEVDVIVGGPPCQGFSALGKRDVNDVRNGLWERYADAIVAAQPKYFVVENVAQFLDSTQFASFERRTWRRNKLQDYDLSARDVLNAADFGAPQLRRRAVVIGRRRDMPIIGLPASDTVKADRRTVRQAFRGMDPNVTERELPAKWTTAPDGGQVRGEFRTTELHVTRNYSPTSKARFKYIPAEGNRFDIPSSLQPACWLNHTTGSGDVMGRLYWERPSVTIRTEFVKPEKGRYLHPEQDRAITLMEGARLQGFSDDYLWCGSKTDIAKQIGNAVPIPLGTAIGQLLQQAL